MKNNAKSSRKEMIEETIEETIEVEKDRYVNLDALKTVAIYLVCMYHYNDYQLDMIHHPSFYTYLSYIIHSLAACAVPLFFMVNGAIRMNRPIELRTNTKRVVRMILLILVWGVVGYTGFRLLNGEPFKLEECITSLWIWRTGEINHLWFLVTLSGIYLILPLLKVLYDNEKQQYMKYFFVLVTIATFGNVCIGQFANILEYIVGVNYIPAAALWYYDE